MKQVPKKNIEPVLVDVKGPTGAHRRALGRAELSLAHRSYVKAPAARPKRRFVSYAVTFAVVVLTALGGAFALGSYAVKDRVATRSQTVADNFSKSVDALQSLDPASASRYLAENQKELNALTKLLGGNGTQGVANILSGVLPAVGEAATLLKNVASLNVNLLKLTTTLQTLQSNGLRSFMGDGTELVTTLRTTESTLHDIIASAQEIKNATGRLKSIASYFGSLDEFVGDRYLTWNGKLLGLEEFLTEFDALITSETPKHILIMFQNPSEIRPGGGFLGSYADLVVQKGHMEKFDVRDIYDADGQLFTNYRSPEAFDDWAVWKARDANWFFDFPTSAEAVTTLMETSKLYDDYGVKFDMTIAVNIRVIETLLAVTGPIELPDYKLTLTDQNFLREVQTEVENGEDKAAGAPKKILTVAAPILLERLGNLSEDQIKTLIDKLGGHYEKKDLMFYARNAKLEHFIREQGGDGGVYALPSGFWGNYLAVVDANIDGKKSDAVIAQAVTAYVDVSSDGSALTDLSITRTHHGDQEEELFWRAKNNDYMQIYAPPGAELVLVKGNDPAPRGTALSPAETERLYPAEKVIEATKKFLTSFQTWTMEAFGKEAFATWLSVTAGKSRTLELRYQVPGKPGVTPKAGDVYTFIYERQSGVPTELSLSIAAPVGFTWKETETPRFTYDKDDVPGRLVLTLTLAK